MFMIFIEDFAKAYESEGSIFGYDAKKIFNETTIYIAPMANPDGVDLVLWQLPVRSSAYMNARNIASGYPNIPFPNGWKAHIVRSSFDFAVSCRIATCT